MQFDSFFPRKEAAMAKLAASEVATFASHQVSGGPNYHFYFFQVAENI